MFRVPSIKLVDFPLVFWAIGFVEFLIRMTLGNPAPQVGAPAWTCSLLAFLFLVYNRQGRLPPLPTRRRDQLPFLALTTAGIAILAVAFLAATRPPHLPQEYDAIHYHMGVARQHYLTGNWQWIPWSVADLWPMAAQLGLSPYWFSLSSFQKIPQWILSVWLFAAFLELCRRERHDWLAWIAPLALLGTQGFVTQLGSAMMDLPLCYFVVAGTLAFLDKRWAVAALHLSLYAASKSFHPIQILFGLIVVGAGTFLFRKDLRTNFQSTYLKLCIAGFVLTLLLLARPMLVSWRATGTPLFPFFACMNEQATWCAPGSEARAMLDSVATELIAVKDRYGDGKGALAFLKHLWTVAIPTYGVNNSFDYPLGLAWLLNLAFLACALVWRPRTVLRSPWLWLFAGSWLLWWIGSQQSRWLYLTMIFGWLAVLPLLELLWAPALIGALLLSSGTSLLSIVRAHLPTSKLSRQEITAREQAKIKWDAQGRLISNELLYVDKAAPTHVRGSPQFILSLEE